MAQRESCTSRCSLTPHSADSQREGIEPGSLYSRFCRLRHEGKPILVDSAEEFGLLGPGNHCLFKRSEIDEIVGCSTEGKCTFRLVAKKPGMVAQWCCNRSHKEDAPEHEFPKGAQERLKEKWTPAHQKHLQALDRARAGGKASPSKKPRKS